VIWWLWVLLGILFLAIELLTPGGFYVLFFGVGALVTGLLVALGVVEPVWAQWLTFTILSVATLGLFRGKLLRKMSAGPQQGAPIDSLVGEAAIVTETVPASGVGRAELRGSAWSARSGYPDPIPKGTRCRVERVEGLTLWIRPD
jgi:membrane protein implicated in regulation of membrane protease activity